jgi:hypothetical protein
MVSFLPLTVPVTGIGSFSLGPTQPVTVLPVCFSEAFPVIVPSDVEIVTCQFPVTSADQTRADDASNSPVSSKTRIFIASPSSTIRKRYGRGSLCRLEFLASMPCSPPSSWPAFRTEFGTVQTGNDCLRVARHPLRVSRKPTWGPIPTREPITAWERSESTGNHLAYSRHAPPNPELFLASTHRLRASSPAHWPEQGL